MPTYYSVDAVDSSFLPRCIYTRWSWPRAKCVSVRFSVYQTRGLWQNESKFCPNFYTSWNTFILVFWQEEWMTGSNPFYLKFGPNWPPWSENTDFQYIFARSASAVTPSKNVQLTLIGSPRRLDRHRKHYISSGVVRVRLWVCESVSSYSYILNKNGILMKWIIFISRSTWHWWYWGSC